MSNNKRLSILAVVLAAVLWGSTGTLQALLPEHKQPLVIGALRLYFAAIYLLVISVIFGQKLFSSILRAPILIAVSGLFMMLYNMSFFAAVLKSGVGLGTAITIGSAPIWALFFEFFVFKSKHGLNKLIGASLAIIGISILMLSVDSGSWSGQGFLLALFSGLSYAFYALCTSRIVKKISHHNSAAWTFLLAAIFSTPVFMFYPFAWAFSSESIYNLIFLGTVATGIAYSAYTFGLKHLSPSSAVTLSIAEPITAVFLATIILRETLSIIQFGAVLVIILGFFLTSKSEAD